MSKMMTLNRYVLTNPYDKMLVKRLNSAGYKVKHLAFWFKRQETERLPLFSIKERRELTQAEQIRFERRK